MRAYQLIISLLISATLVVGFALSRVNADSGDQDTELIDELKTFTDVLSIVRNDYVTPVTNKKLIEGAIKGMLTTLDPHSGYLDPSFYQDLQIQTKGEFGGLGIELTSKDGMLVVVSPMEGSPAEAAGVRAGDAIIKIDGKFTKDVTLVDAVKKLRGAKGTPIRLSLYRRGLSDLIEVTVMRDIINVKSVRKRGLGDGYGYVRISQFMEKTTDDLEAALRTLAKESPSGDLKGLVIDLRNNPGGLLNQAVRVSDLFLKEGVIVYTDGRVESQKQKFYAHERGTEPNYPIVVIVNGGSASASEIVAGALKDAGRALILGTQTFGKGSVQTVTPLENGGALTLTTALYYTKSGHSIQVTGVKPDIEIADPNQPQKAESNEDDVPGVHLKIREGDLPGAIDNPTDKPGRESSPTGALDRINKTPKVGPDLSRTPIESRDLNQWLREDPQFQRAFDMLKGFGIFTKPGELTQSGPEANPAPVS